jgi:hypothetical protein
VAFFIKMLRHRQPLMAMGRQCLCLLAAICMATVKRSIKVQILQTELCTSAWLPKLRCLHPSREPMNRRSSAVFQEPIGEARAYLMWPKVLFEFKLGQIEGEVPDESRVRGLGRERDFFTRRISTGVAAVYHVVKEDVA